jgi:GT2 family glycosyltransferase
MTQRRPPDELVIVDAGSQPDLGSRLSQQTEGQMPLVHVRSKPGLTHQRNVGIASSQGDAVLFLDDDVELDERYVDEVAGLLESDASQSLDAVRGTVVECSGGQPHRPAATRSWRHTFGQTLERVFLLAGDGDGRLKRSGFPTRLSQGKPSYVQVLSGCSMCFRRKVFDTVRFDEKLTGYGWMEDVDMSRQLQEKGFRIYYWPAARLIHHNSGSARTPPAALGRMMAHNHYYLYRKHSDSSRGGWLAFWWSSVGLVVYAAGKGEWHEVRGLLDGYHDALRGRNPLLETGP